MTEALKQWIKSKTGEANSFDVAEAEFWLRAFCETLEEQADNKYGFGMFRIAYDDLKRELLGE